MCMCMCRSLPPDGDVTLTNGLSAALAGSTILNDVSGRSAKSVKPIEFDEGEVYATLQTDPLHHGEESWMNIDMPNNAPIRMARTYHFDERHTHPHTHTQEEHKEGEEVQNHTPVTAYLNHHYYNVTVHGSDWVDISTTGTRSFTSDVDDDIHLCSICFVPIYCLRETLCASLYPSLSIFILS